MQAEQLLFASTR